MSDQSHRMTVLEATVEIVTTALSPNGAQISPESADLVAIFTEIIYKKIADLENKPH